MKKFISTLLVVAILCTMIPFQVVMAADTDILYNTQRTDFVLSEANGANAKMFMLKDGSEHKAGADFTDYVKGLDYTSSIAYDDTRKGIYPTGTDSDAMSQNSPIGALVYTIDGKDNNDNYNNYANFVTKNGKIYWNIDGKDYLINPQDKAIKLYTQVNTDDVTDAALAERFKTLNEVTFDVEDGNYYEIGFLAATTYKRTLNVTLVYTDGSTEKQSVVVPTGFTNVGQSTGSVYFQQVNTHAIAALGRKFKPYTVLADTNKTLDKVKLSSNFYANPIIIISAWGEKPSVKSMLDKITNADELTEENYLTAQSEIEKVMAYIEVCGLTYNDLDKDMKAKIDAINNPFGYILANMIAKLDANEEITGANIYEIKDALAKIEEFKNSNNLSYSAQDSAKLDTINNNISAVEEQVIIEDIIDKISKLPEITTENFKEVSKQIKEIRNLIAENNVAEEQISNINALNKAEENLEIVAQDMTVLVPMDIQDGANVKLFLEENETDPAYVEWADYIASSYIGTVSATSTYTPRVLRYSETKEQTMSLIKAPNKIWTVNGVPYKIGSDVLGIRLHGARTVSTGDAKLSTLLNSYKEATINLEKGYYSKLHILAINPHGYDKDPESDVTYVITYKDGTTVEGGLLITNDPKIEGFLPEYGYVLGTNIVPGESGSNICKFGDYVIETDPNKQLDTIKFTCSETQRTVYIAGITGETAKLSSIKTAIMDRLSYSIPAIGTSSKDVLLEIEDLVKEYESAGADADKIDGISKFNQDIATYYQGEISLDTTRAYTDFDNSYFEATFSKNIKVPENVVAVKKGKDYLTSDKFTMSVEGKTLKIVIPDNHKEIVTYTIEIAAGVLNADNQMFNTYKASSFEFKSEKAVSIDKFELVDGTVNVTVTNNMSEKIQDYVLVIGAYNSDNKKVGMKIVCGTLDKKGAENSTIQAALNASEFADGVKIECYLADRMNTLKYLDRAEPILVAAQ